MRCADPFASFEALQPELDVSLERLLALAAHLERWGFARIIAPLSAHAVLTVAESR